MKRIFGVVQALIMLFALGSCQTLAGVSETGESPVLPVEGATFPLDRYVEGAPSLDLRVKGGVYIWRDGNNWHFRVAKKHDQTILPTSIGPVVTGSIRVEKGRAANVRRYQVTQLNDVRSKGNDIFYRFQMRRDFGNDIEGFDFIVKPTGLDYCVLIEVEADGAPRPGIVHLGNFMHLPDALPLRICVRSFS